MSGSAFSEGLNSRQGDDRSLKTYFSTENRRDYAPPLLGNGEMALQMDYLGQTVFTPTDTEPCERVAASPFVWWEGRRYMYDVRRFLIPFGKLTAEVSGLSAEPDEWTQSLDTERGLMTSVCRFGETRIRIEAFVHHDSNLLCVRRTFTGTGGRTLTLGCRLTDNKTDAPDRLPRYMTLREEADGVTGGLALRYSVFGQRDYAGCIRLFTDRPAVCRREGTLFTLSCPAEGSVSWFMLLRDDLNEAEYEAVSRRQALGALQKGFDGLLAEHASRWKSYLDEGSFVSDDPELNEIYSSARYDLKCYTSRWSVPVGISDASWEGKYFAYDEYFGFAGLLTGGHKSLALRVPAFRRAGLEQAITRMSSRGLREARFPWEAVETGEDATIPGYWYEHVFHMANISVGAWEYYAYTLDRSYLSEIAWPVLRACAEFYLRHMVYQVEGGKTIIGRCTDWERLGSSVQNAYMTTCGVIRTLRLSARAAGILGLEPEFAARALETADRLYDGLPAEEGRYVPHPGCAQRSIGVFGGLFPYAVTDRNDPLQAAAIEDYRAHESLYGNMYATGSGISPWFASWIALAFARLRKPAEAMAYLRRAAAGAGCFGELYEINEPGKYYRPWFSTANGIFQAAVHNMLLQSSPEGIELLPGWPEDAGGVSFTLPAEGDLTVSLRAEAGQITLLRILGGRNAADSVRVTFPSGEQRTLSVEKSADA